MEFPEGTVVRLFSSSQELTDKEFFLIKLEKVEMPKAKKRKLLVDYHKRFFNEISDFIMGEIDYVVKRKIYCATSKSGKKYYLCADFNFSIFSRPYIEEDCLLSPAMVVGLFFGKKISPTVVGVFLISRLISSFT